MKAPGNNSWQEHRLYSKTFRQKDITFCILIFHDKRPFISMNSEIKVAFPSKKLRIKGCIQQPTPQYENEVIVGLWIFYNFSEALRKQVTMRLHTVCKYSMNMIRNVHSVAQCHLRTAQKPQPQQSSTAQEPWTHAPSFPSSQKSLTDPWSLTKWTIRCNFKNT